MRWLWMFIERKKWRSATKYKFAFLVVGTIFSIVGLIAWLIIRNWALSAWNWMVCFIGYPVIISWLVVFLYAYKHDFHNRSA